MEQDTFYNPINVTHFPCVHTQKVYMNFSGVLAGAFVRLADT